MARKLPSRSSWAWRGTDARQKQQVIREQIEQAACHSALSGGRILACFKTQRVVRRRAVVKSPKWDDGLRRLFRDSIQSPKAKAAYDEMVARAVALTDHYTEPAWKGAVRNFRYLDPTTGARPFAFITNRKDLLFYVRQTGKRRVPGGLPALRRLFANAKENPSGEWTVRIANATDAGRLSQFLFGTGRPVKLRYNNDQQGKVQDRIRRVPQRDSRAQVRINAQPQLGQLDYRVQTKAAVRRAERAEASLVEDYTRWLRARGRTLMRYSAGRLMCDAFEEATQHLIEAKSSTRREYIRMAVGQLLEYAYLGRSEFEDPRLAILLPSRPRLSQLRWLEPLRIHVIWRDEDGFKDNAGGIFCNPKS